MTVLTWCLLGVAVAAATAGWFVTGRPRTAAAALVCALTAATAAIGTASADAAVTDRVGTLVIVTLTGLLAVAGGGPVTVAVFYLVDGHQGGGQDAGAVESVRRAGEALRGGAWIGALERAGVFAALVAGWPEGVAIALGLKGLGRYPELRTGDSPGAAERFIIGTFTSVLWAVACAGLARLLWWPFW